MVVTLDAHSRHLLQTVIKVLCKETAQSGDVEAILGRIEVLLTGATLTDGYDYVGPGNTGNTVGFESYSIQNTGMTDALVDGKVFPPGAVIEYSGEKGDTHSGKTYDTQLTTLMITTVLR